MTANEKNRKENQENSKEKLKEKNLNNEEKT